MGMKCRAAGRSRKSTAIVLFRRASLQGKSGHSIRRKSTQRVAGRSRCIFTSGPSNRDSIQRQSSARVSPGGGFGPIGRFTGGIGSAFDEPFEMIGIEIGDGRRLVGIVSKARPEKAARGKCARGASRALEFVTGNRRRVLTWVISGLGHIHRRHGEGLRALAQYQTTQSTKTAVARPYRFVGAGIDQRKDRGCDRTFSALAEVEHDGRADW